ncbi:MAG: ATP-binding protein [Acidimicrobiales bacterium]
MTDIHDRATSPGKGVHHGEHGKREAASRVGAEPPFDVITTAYECTRLIVTGNLPFDSWTGVLGAERLTGAILDRLAHRCNIIETKGESRRLQDAKTRTRRAKPPADPSGNKLVDQAKVAK